MPTWAATFSVYRAVARTFGLKQLLIVNMSPVFANILRSRLISFQVCIHTSGKFLIETGKSSIVDLCPVFSFWRRRNLGTSFNS